VAGIVGFAAALRAVLAGRDEAAARVRALRDRLAAGLHAVVPDLVETAALRPDGVAGLAHPPTAGHGGGSPGCLPGTLHVCVPGIESEPLLFLLDEAGVCASAASACASGAHQASHVLAAMGVPADLARGALRLSLGWTSTQADVDRAVAAVAAAVDRLQAVSA
jgi:cysteine desulfurase